MIIAGTGHRPNKLGGYSNDAFNNLVQIAQKQLLILKPEYVISGMALGWDQALAMASNLSSIEFDAYIPFSGQANAWPYPSQKRYEWLLNRARNKIYICEPGYAAWKMQKRNEAMVDACDTILAMYNGTSGGTANCIRYAQQQNKTIINLWKKSCIT